MDGQKGSTFRKNAHEERSKATATTACGKTPGKVGGEKKREGKKQKTGGANGAFISVKTKLFWPDRPPW